MFENTLDVRRVQNNSEITTPAHRIKCGVATVIAQARWGSYNVSLGTPMKKVAFEYLKPHYCFNDLLNKIII